MNIKNKIAQRSNRNDKSNIRDYIVEAAAGSVLSPFCNLCVYTKGKLVGGIFNGNDVIAASRNRGLDTFIVDPLAACYTEVKSKLTIHFQFYQSILNIIGKKVVKSSPNRVPTN